MRDAPAAIALHCLSGPLLRLVSGSAVVRMLSSVSTVARPKCLSGMIWHMRGILPMQTCNETMLYGTKCWTARQGGLLYNSRLA